MIYVISYNVYHDALLQRLTMQYIERIFDPRPILQKKSLFLFGPRQTGKSALIKRLLPGHKLYNLLNKKTFLALQTNPSLIREELTDKDRIIVIDEIQKIPGLLDEIHLMIEDYNINFLLTGSSARTLKRRGVNMLGGRARSRSLYPFIRKELGNLFDLKKALVFGLLPPIFFSDDPYDDLKSYVADYLKEEIAAEAVARNISAFSRFLEVASLCHGKMVNYTQVSSDSGIPISTVREYFQILQDTLIGTMLKAYSKTIKRKAITTSKFYFFDNGCVNAITGRKELVPKTPEFGDAFESYIFHELKAYCTYNNIDDFTYWRSKSMFEVDFILEDRIAIEVKAKDQISGRELKGLKALREENQIERYVVIAMTERKRIVDGIEIIPWEEFLEELWH